MKIRTVGPSSVILSSDIRSKIPVSGSISLMINSGSLSPFSSINTFPDFPEIDSKEFHHNYITIKLVGRKWTVDSESWYNLV